MYCDCWMEYLKYSAILPKMLWVHAQGPWCIIFDIHFLFFHQVLDNPQDISVFLKPFIKQSKVKILMESFFSYKLWLLCSLLHDFLLHRTPVPPSFDTTEWCITLEWANNVSIYQTNKRIHVIENWKMLAYKIKDLNVNPVRGLEIKILSCPSKGYMIPIWCPAVWLPIYNNVAEITRLLLCWWSLIWSSQRFYKVSLKCLVSILLFVSMSVS